ncbi:ribosomal protein s30, putative [Entamoeba histolytica HM-3:IMSS]|uniref:40S ribosomal protein S30 n=7 Tax=Entamoeba TaxID=5758 RepID=C4M912_ENTH1|nr:ribosomal protein s30, putative [Entamoeba nuttalli P19]XP_651894.1 Ribosomal protein S30, putative [Entamoeba histolytica HM-1:IMSS]EMD47303.1 ribosomal protein S30 [Entamoeba histolytica KU27]EMS12066.1 ribosomal protein s30, putative [Entamoeba histolytica HM-3:IMSS]ENY61409.1 ribosomal protein s30, putative [Entamoeba histolytica HM-1:IMSS-A]GAT98114.1 ribosomal protein s30 putative [Entamoeba histolytica]EAL46505.1 Ribosomal protein S30, putative [Entamoeba histolytica HM-1:IMSS]|eukprot:XP_008857570.1 ribosomal protein s30, putative [Entamoeba nuttalli P19]
MGKVHGGLTRAGKVRNQTKKVEQEQTGRKKHPSGRANLREKYNKRQELLNGETKKYKFNAQS